MCLEEALQKVGDFGFTQKLLAFVTAISRTSGNAFVYAYAFLIMPQKYECAQKDTPNLFTSCSIEEVCQAISEGPTSSSIEYRLDTSYKNYVVNWYAQMNLGCMSSTAGAQIVCYFFLASIVVGILSFVPDRIGRKKTVIGSLFLSLIAQSILIWYPSFLARQIAFILLGLSTMKAAGSYVWISDTVPQKYLNGCFTMITTIDTVPIPITGLVFLYLKPDWFLVPITYFALASLALLIGLFMPESPRWLLLTN